MSALFIKLFAATTFKEAYAVYTSAGQIVPMSKVQRIFQNQDGLPITRYGVLQGSGSCEESRQYDGPNGKNRCAFVLMKHQLIELLLSPYSIDRPKTMALIHQ